MLRLSLFALVNAGLAAASLPGLGLLFTNAYTPVCQSISAALSDASAVYYPGSFKYTTDISHASSSSSNSSACSVRPATAADVGIVLNIVGSTNTPFAVKGGGHTANPGYSSTAGVHISLANFNNIDYDSTTSSVTIGGGLIWDDVYAALAPHGVNVVGGRVTGVGVAGFTLGGGYGWLTNQHGLTIDTAIEYELVLPNGTVVYVNDHSHSELFWGLKGGFNNFGIVTRFTLKTFAQGPVWGGTINIGSVFYDPVIAAVANFSANNTDPKASLLATFNSPAVAISIPLVTIILFYDGPMPPPGTFDAFLAVPFITKDIRTRDFLSLVQSAPANATLGSRGVFNTIPTPGTYTADFLKALANETLYWGSLLALDSAMLISYDAEPFLPSALSFGNSSSSAWPPSRSPLYQPTFIYYAWNLPIADDTMRTTIASSAEHLKAVAAAQGQDLAGASVYGNYAAAGTPLEDIYGANLPRLKQLKKAVDPTNIMGLAGGWKFA